MSSLGFNANQHGNLTRLRRLQSGRKFEAVRRNNTIIVIRRDNQRCRIRGARLR